MIPTTNVGAAEFLPRVILFLWGLLALTSFVVLRSTRAVPGAAESKSAQSVAAQPPMAADSQATASLPTADTRDTRGRAACESLLADDAELHARPVGALSIQVETATQPSVGLPIALTHTTESLKTEVISELPVDAEGCVRFSRTLCSPRNATGVRCIDVGFPSVGAYATQLDPDTEQVRMFSPDRAYVRIEVREANDSPLRVPARVGVHVLTATPPADRRHSYEITDGHVELAVEAASLRLEFVVETHDGRRSRPLETTGPALPSGVSTCVIHMAPRTMFSARVLDSTGRPLQQAEVEVRLAQTSIRLDDHVRTGADGVVVFAQPHNFRAGQHWSLRLLAKSSDDRLLYGELLADFSPGAGTELGEVWLQDTVLLVAGVCIDEHGTPLSNIALSVQVESPQPERHLGTFHNGYWHDLAQDATRTAEDGTFDIHAPPQFGQSLRLRARGRPDVLVPFDAGARSLSFVLPCKTRDRLVR